MSTPTRRGRSGGLTGDETWGDLLTGGNRAFRLVALASMLVLTASYIAILRYLTNVVGGRSLLVPLVVVLLLAATLLARYVNERAAFVLALSLGIAGYAYYLLMTPRGLEVVFTASDQILADTISLLTGLSVLRMTKAAIWAIGFAPAPVFLSWYFVVRRRYVLGALVGVGALSVLVLTGDASLFAQREGINVTLVGALAAVAVVGFGELERRDGSLAEADVVVVLLALMAVSAPLLTLVPGGAGGPLFLSGGFGGGASTVEGSLTGSPERVNIQGSIRLSPKVRFTIEAETKEYWRVGVYDRFTGTSWIRSGSTAEYRPNRLPRPAGATRDLVQAVTVESQVSSMPAAAQVVRVRGDVVQQTLVTEHGGIRAQTSFIEGDSYVVESEILTATPQELREASTDYPERIAETYLRTPATTPDRVGELAANLTAGEDNPYDEARAIETWLEANKNYSLQVDRPNGNIVDNFLFEMEQGYCTYYASSMVVMLREQGIPARFVVGYTPGQEVDRDTYVVRGLDSHAWVEAYFPEHGWVRFDPTPGGPRAAAEASRINDARESGESNVDTERSADQPITTPENTTTPTNDDPIDFGNITPTGNRTITQPGGVLDGGANGTIPGPGPDVTTVPGGNGTIGGNGSAGAAGSRGGPLDWVPSPSRGQLVLALIALVGLTAGAHRRGMTDAAWRFLGMHWQGARRAPDADVERAYDRLETLLSRRYRDRRPGETPREYRKALSLAGLDDRAARAMEIHERARYGDGVTREQADEAIRLVDQLVGETVPVVGRVRRVGRRRAAS